MRIYDPIGQKSVKTVQDISVPPALELELIKNKEDLTTILDYLGPNKLLLFLMIYSLWKIGMLL